MIPQYLIKENFLFNKLSNTELDKFIKKAKIITLKEGSDSILQNE